MSLTEKQWIALIEKHREDIEEEMKDAYEQALDSCEEGMRDGGPIYRVIIDNNGNVDTHVATDDNETTRAEFDGNARLIWTYNTWHMSADLSDLPDAEDYEPSYDLDECLARIKPTHDQRKNRSAGYER
jgi:hypothetical protein